VEDWMKKRSSETKSNQSRELSSLSKSLFIIASLAIGVAIMAIAFWVSSNPAVRDPSVENWRGAIGQEILIAIGTSIIASILFYILYSMSAEDKVLREISESSAKVATEFATSLFQQRFESMLPVKVYPATAAPVEEFDIDFDNLLHDSKIYKHKGDSAGFATFRLTVLSERGYPLDKEITLLLLDPRRNDLFEERAKHELSILHKMYNKAQLFETANKLRNNVYITLMGLYDICHITKVQVAFYEEHVFFRTELMDKGAFLTYYLGGEFPGSYLYSQKTFTYKAYFSNFRQVYDASTKKICFDNRLQDDEFSKYLQELGCEFDIDELRKLKDERYEKYRFDSPLEKTFFGQ
jgi:hypothetical protein